MLAPLPVAVPSPAALTLFLFAHLPGVATGVPPSPAPTTGTEPAATGGGIILVLMLIGAALSGAYLVSIRLHPFKKCPRCGGTGKTRGTVFTGAFRACGRCGGKGREHRWLASGPYVQDERKRGGRG